MDRETGPLADFETFLSKLGTIPEGKIKFYLYWVRRLLKSCNYQLNNITVKILDSPVSGTGLAKSSPE